MIGFYQPQSSCPHCGYCPSCGRANAPYMTPYWPTWPPYPMTAPWYQGTTGVAPLTVGDSGTGIVPLTVGAVNGANGL